VTTVALAAGLWRLARAGALVRRLPAVETLGSTTVICSDKTGTMTENRMSVSRFALDGRTITVTGGADSPRGAFLAEGAELDPLADADLVRLLTIGVLVNDASVGPGADRLTLHGDPTEAALLVAAVKAGLDPAMLVQQWPRRREIPFDPALRLMATFNERPGGGKVVLVKGGPGVVVERSSHRQTRTGRVPLAAEDREGLLEQNRALAGDGLRVLAVAWRPDGWPDGTGIEGLTFLGFVGLRDPVKPGVKEAIARCEAAGIRTVMLTGDQRATAEAIGRELGLAPDAIRSRVSPEDKLELIKALQAEGEVVAMTGDGVNDAPALARADIGIAMGLHGTDVAREAADLVLTDDNFTTIVGAVEEGRVIYANLRKVIRFLFTCNLSEILTIFVAILFGFPAPLLPLQILWVNLVTDILPAMALIRDPAEPDVMRRPPRDLERSQHKGVSGATEVGGGAVGWGAAPRADVLESKQTVHRWFEDEVTVLAQIRAGTPRHEMHVAARRAPLCGDGNHRVFVGLIGNWKDDLVNQIPRTLVVDNRPRTELGDGEESWTGQELVPPRSCPAPRDVGRQRQARETVAWQEALAGEVPVAIEVGLRNVLGPGQQLDLGLSLLAQSLGLNTLRGRPRVIQDDPVLEFALIERSPIQASPSFARALEGQWDLDEDIIKPGCVPPVRRRQLLAHRVEDATRARPGSLACAFGR
jgi:soluble P-type ATPase